MNGRFVAGLSAAAALTLVTAGAAHAATTGGTVTAPSSDPFYTYRGKTPLADISPGTPLAERAVTLGAGTSSTPVPAEQILYRTTDATGHPIATVTTVVLPATGTVAPKVVGYLSFYDALSNQCDPSFTLRGGDPGSANQQTADIEQGVVENLRADGYIVTVPDFEDENLDYVAGNESGMSTLDGVRATEAWLGLGRTTPVGLMGYSGGPSPRTGPASWPPATPPTCTWWGWPKAGYRSTWPTTSPT